MAVDAAGAVPHNGPRPARHDERGQLRQQRRMGGGGGLRRLGRHQIGLESHRLTGLYKVKAADRLKSLQQGAPHLGAVVAVAADDADIKHIGRSPYLLLTSITEGAEKVNFCGAEEKQTGGDNGRRKQELSWPAHSGHRTWERAKQGAARRTKEKRNRKDGAHGAMRTESEAAGAQRNRH